MSMSWQAAARFWRVVSMAEGATEWLFTLSRASSSQKAATVASLKMRLLRAKDCQASCEDIWSLYGEVHSRGCTQVWQIWILTEHCPLLSSLWALCGFSVLCSGACSTGQTCGGRILLPPKFTFTGRPWALTWNDNKGRTNWKGFEINCVYL